MKFQAIPLLFRIMNRLFLNRMSKKKRYQEFFELMHFVSLKGMNYGNASSIKENGEFTILQYIKEKKQQQEEIILFDVGANNGDYSKMALGVFQHTDLIIHSFEPSKTIFANLTLNLSNTQVRVHNIALSDKIGKANLYLNGDTALSGLSSLYKRDLANHNIELNLTEEIEATTIDAFCKTNNIHAIDFLKLDIEGHELKALEGAKYMIENNRIDFIQFEFGGTDIDSRIFFKDFYRFLKPKYDLFRIVKDGIQPVRNYDESCEVFLAINFLAQRRK